MIIELNLPVKPLEIYNSIRNQFQYTALLESITSQNKLARQSIIVFDPDHIVEFRAGKLYKKELNNNIENIVAIGLEDATDYMRNQLKKDNTSHEESNFMFGYLGYTSYDLVKYTSSIEIDDSKNKFPIFIYPFYKKSIIIDHVKNQVYFNCINLESIPEVEIDQIVAEEINIENLEFNYSKNEFINLVDRIKDKIYHGEVFQTVLSQQCDFDLNSDPFQMYLRIRDINPSPFMYILEFNRSIIIGASPELLISKINERLVTYPIAGTRKLSKDVMKNHEIELDLLNDEKELAEHNMLVDLARNDLGRVSKIGYVTLPQYCKVEYFSHVMHIVSRVEGIIDSDLDSFDVFYALFPAGTVSGAPKIRSMRYINQFEKINRGPYAGSVGYFDVNGNMEHAIAIRTIFGSSSHYKLQAGAGIVHASVPENEYEETLSKMASFLKIILPEMS